MSEHAPGGYERRDTNVRVLVAWAGALVGLIVLAMIGMWVLLRGLAAQVDAVREAPHPLAPERVLPPGPRLQAAPVVERDAHLREEEQLLSTYGWVDANAGVVRLPLERAAEVALERGFPVAGSDAAEGAPGPSSGDGEEDER